MGSGDANVSKGFDEMMIGDGVKPLFHVRKTAATWRLFASWLCQVLVTCKRASWDEEWGLKPNWQLERS